MNECNVNLILNDNNCDVNLILNDNNCDVNLILSSVPPMFKWGVKTFTGDGSGNQVINLDGALVDNSERVYFAGVLASPSDYTISSDKRSITITKSWQTGRPGEIQYVYV